jgi:hypothetical protein
MQNIVLESLKSITNYKDKYVSENALFKEIVFAYDKYRLSVRELHLYKELGKRVDGLSILDIGSGTCMTATAIIENCNSQISYCSIDKNIDPSDILQDLIIENKITNFEHYHHDVFEPDFDAKFSLQNKYDIMLIDIEPHGREIDVYDKFKKFMNNEHLCILKHVAFIDLFGCAFADRFIEKYNYIIKDYFAERDSNDEIRDVLIIMNSQNCNQELQIQNLAHGNISKWTDSNGVLHIGYCLVNW